MTGSSPRVRGTRRSMASLPFAVGIIPACAGNTCSPLARLCLGWDHPRVCGEHPLCSIAWHPQAGSSPRVRGTLRSMRSWFCRSRIIPACAGNTRRAARATASSRDHPRVCGEHAPYAVEQNQGEGSSPRVRGTPSLPGWRARLPGIIPACAGNTFTAFSIPSLVRDHPRVCGEHYVLKITANEKVGSSPRVRGTLLKIPVQNTIATELRLLFNEFAK